MDEYIERDEIRKAYEKLTRSYVNGDPYIADWRLDEMIEILPAADVAPVQEWVSVEDRLPEENTTVIVATDNGIVFQCLYSYDGWDLWDDNDVNITHWQPMPQPPKGE